MRYLRTPLAVVALQPSFSPRRFCRLVRVASGRYEGWLFFFPVSLGR